MFFLMECSHNPGKEEERDRLRAAHRNWVRSGGGVASVLIGSAIWDEHGRAIGNFGIIEAESEETARAFADGDPFSVNGIVADIRLTRLADSFQEQRIDRMTDAEIWLGRDATGQHKRNAKQ
jgi:uncharacterized protein YciI